MDQCIPHHCSFEDYIHTILYIYIYYYIYSDIPDKFKQEELKEELKHRCILDAHNPSLMDVEVEKYLHPPLEAHLYNSVTDLIAPDDVNVAD